jgi:acetyl-CoA carboxylase/biotin carboxylase 1
MLQVLIANNGMAATKSILSMRQWAYMELGDDRAIEFIAMATPEDLNANAEFIRLADRFVEVLLLAVVL